MICFKAFEGKSWKIEKSKKSNQNNVMNEKNREEWRDGCYKLSKVVVGLSKFKIGGLNTLQPGNQKLLEEIVDRTSRGC